MFDSSAVRNAAPLSVAQRRLANALVSLASVASGIRPSLIRYGGREPRLARLRWAVMYALRQIGEAQWSYPVIASYFLMDHSTIIHGVRQCERVMAGDEEYSTFVASMVQRARHG